MLFIARLENGNLKYYVQKFSDGWTTIYHYWDLSGAIKVARNAPRELNWRVIDSSGHREFVIGPNYRSVFCPGRQP